jgi:(p)ppGpp synthase/HD superfamily hydrolase
MCSTRLIGELNDSLLTTRLPIVDLSRSSLQTCQTSTVSQYTIKDIQAIRNALKLSTKIFYETDSKSSNSILDHKSHISSELGLMLSMSSCSAKDIVVGFLYNIPLNKLDPKYTQTLDYTIQRKFGSGILEQIKLCQDFVSGTYDLSSNKVSNNLLCAIACSLVSPQSLSKYNLNELISHFEVSEVSPLLLQQLKLEALSSGQLAKSTISLNQENIALCKILDSYKVASHLFSGESRKWGLNGKLSLSSHQCEVGLISILTGQPLNVCIAGMLHDLFEGYITYDQELTDFVEGRFGQEVLDLIISVTEPPKKVDPVSKKEDLQDWKNRKNAVINSIQNTNSAALSACTKISTIAAGSKILYEGGKVSDWSQASAKENNKVFHDHMSLYLKHTIDMSLLELYEFEFSKFLLLQAK